MPVSDDESETTEPTSIEKIHYEISKLSPPSKKFKLKGKKTLKIKFFQSKKTTPNKTTSHEDKSETTEPTSIEKIHYEISKLPPLSKKFKPKGKKTSKIKFYQPEKAIPIKTDNPNPIIPIVGILLVILGLLAALPNSPITQTQGITLALIGIIIIFFIPTKKLLPNEKDIFIALALIIWIITSYFITFQADSEFLFIIILVGFLIITELSQQYVSKNFQKRLNIIDFALILVFLLIIAEKITIILRS